MKKLTAPFPYYGGKGRIASKVWEKFGTVDRYIDPFFGSGAVLWANPNHASFEIVCDTNGYICNVWRAIQQDPEQVAYWTDYPTIHQDLTARNTWLMEWHAEHKGRLSEDPMFYDTRVAGWWIWGMSIWIGSGFCVKKQSIKRPFVSKDGTGQGANKQRKDINIQEWFIALSKRMEKIIILNCDWEAIKSPTILGKTKKSAKRKTAIFLDPPYLSGKRSVLYDSDFEMPGNNDIVAKKSYAWAVEMANTSDCLIAYCCHAGDFSIPEGWAL